MARRPPAESGTGAALAVRDAARGNLDVGAGETVVLLGASGQGKTAWLRALLGLGVPFDAVTTFGRPLTKDRIPDVVSWVPEGDGVFLSETVWANVAKAPAASPGVHAAHAADALDLVGLADRAGQPVADLGAGGRRRVALARAIARRRPLLIVDGELDPTLWAFWPALAARMPWLHGTIVASSTGADTAWRADSVALIDGGAIVGQGPFALLHDSRDPKVREVMAWVTP